MSGTVLWSEDSEKKYVNRGWNIYSVTVIPDMDNDGVADLIISHGGDPTVPAEVRSRGLEERVGVEVMARRGMQLRLLCG